MAEQAFGEALLGLSHVIQRRHAQICADHDLTPAQAQLLCMVKDGPRRMAELAASLGMAKNALSQLVDRTERRGLVHRESDGNDRRVITLAVTAAGKEAAEAVHGDVARRLPDLAEGLSPGDRRQLHGLAASVAAEQCPGRTCS